MKNKELLFCLILIFVSLIGNAQEKKIGFAKEIQPIIDQKCVSCHGPGGEMENLRFDSAEEIQKSNADGYLIVAGEPSESPFFQRISLPIDDFDVMPPAEFGNPVTAKEIELIGRWISDGVNFGDVKTEITKPKKVINISPADPEAIAEIENFGALALPLGQNTNWIQIDFSQIPDRTTDEKLSILEPIAEQLRWLNLKGSKITDDGVEKLAKFKNLTRLHLEKTEISDLAIEKISPLIYLEYINLYDTNVTDRCIETLAKFPDLKKLYLWKTKITADKIYVLIEKRPDLEVSFGWVFDRRDHLIKNLPIKFFSTFFGESCCYKAYLADRICTHECCLEAAKKDLICLECNKFSQDLAEKTDQKIDLVALFDPGSCCDKADKNGKNCDHPCCVEARDQNTICLKCNPGAAEKLENQK